MQCGGHWKSKQVQLYCDNKAAVAVLNVGYSHNSLIINAPIESTIIVKPHFNLDVRVTDIPGKDNVVADAIYFP